MFVERCFELDGQSLPTRFNLPEKQPTGEFLASGLIAWPDGDQPLEARGEDGVQALMLVLKLAHLELTSTEAYREGRLTLWTQRDLDLPPTWGSGPLYGDPRQWATSSTPAAT